MSWASNLHIPLSDHFLWYPTSLPNLTCQTLGESSSPQISPVLCPGSISGPTTLLFETPNLWVILDSSPPFTPPHSTYPDSQQDLPILLENTTPITNTITTYQFLLLLPQCRALCELCTIIMFDLFSCLQSCFLYIYSLQGGQDDLNQVQIWLCIALVSSVNSRFSCQARLSMTTHLSLTTHYFHSLSPAWWADNIEVPGVYLNAS